MCESEREIAFDIYCNITSKTHNLEIPIVYSSKSTCGKYYNRFLMVNLGEYLGKLESSENTGNYLQKVNTIKLILMKYMRNNDTILVPSIEQKIAWDEILLMINWSENRKIK